jgi:hypothetical protein
MPSEYDLIVGAFLLFLVVVLPVLGLTVRIALKPIVSSLLLLRRELRGSVASGPERARLRQLEEEVEALQGVVSALKEERDFSRALLGEGGPTPPFRS